MAFMLPGYGAQRGRSGTDNNGDLSTYNLFPVHIIFIQSFFVNATAEQDSHF